MPASMPHQADCSTLTTATPKHLRQLRKTTYPAPAAAAGAMVP
jgi:hypothetical protein